MDVVKLNQKGAALTMESIIAALVLIGAISFLAVSFPIQFNQKNQYSQVQLKEYGKNFIHSAAHKALESGKIAYNLFREYSPREEGVNGGEPGNKWYYDNLSSENISKTDYEGTIYDWTTHQLVIDHDDEIWPEDGDYQENLTINFLAEYNPGANFLYPKNNGTLYLMTPFNKSGEEGGIFHYTNTNSIKVNHESNKFDSSYTVSMVWFEKKRRTSNPLLIWTDKLPKNHDDVLEFDKNESQGTVYKDKHLADIVQGESVIVQKDGKGQLLLYGYNETQMKIENPNKIETEKGVRVEGQGKGKYKITFEDPARGAYAIHSGKGWRGTDRSDPIFVMVGKPKRIGQVRLAGEYSYLEAVTFGDISINEFKNVLNSTMPDNVGYNFYVYSPNGSILKSRIGEKLKVFNGPAPSDSVSVERVVYLQTGIDVYKTCSVRMELWYR
ncbi:hypothetical protein C9439_06215 [archaeon SCG-AAA382B04]|nr:hypothetical protein C9439_06215 [archaeon SCG-AAA382B04]